MLLCHLWTLTQWSLRASSSNQLESAAALTACTCHRGANMTYCSDCRHQTHLSGGSHCHHSPAPRWAEAGGFLAWRSHMLSLSLPNLSLGCFPIPLIDISSLPRLKRKSLWSTVPKALISASEERGTHTTAGITRVFLMADKPPVLPLTGRCRRSCWSLTHRNTDGASWSVFLQRLNLICFLIQHPVKKSDSECWCRHWNIIELTVKTINVLPLLCLFVLIQYFWKSSRFMMKKNWWEHRQRPKPIRRITKICSIDENNRSSASFIISFGHVRSWKCRVWYFT